MGNGNAGAPARADAPLAPKVLKALLCLLLAFAMLLSMCLPSISALGLGGGDGVAWAAEDDDDDDDVPDDEPEQEEDTASDKSAKLIKSPTALDAKQTLKLGKAKIKKVSDGSNLTWYNEGALDVYMVNNYGKVTRPTKTPENGNKSRSNNGNTIIKCAGWAHYKLRFRLADVGGKWGDEPNGVAVVNGYGKLNTNSKSDSFEASKRVVKLKLEFVKSKGTIGKLALNGEMNNVAGTNTVKMKTDVGVDPDLSKTCDVITPIWFTYTMPSADQQFGLAYQNSGDNMTEGYNSKAEPVTTKDFDSSKGYVSHRLGWKNDKGGKENTKEYTPLAMNQKAADGKKTVDLAITCNAASCGLRSSTVWKSASDGSAVKAHNRNTGTWIVAGTKPLYESVKFDLDGGVAKVSNNTLKNIGDGKTNYGYCNGTAQDGTKLKGEGTKQKNGAKMVIQNPTKKDYIFAGWQWVPPSKGDKYSDTKRDGTSYAKQASTSTMMSSNKVANKYALDTGAIEGRVYDKSKDTSTDWEKALEANDASRLSGTPTTVTFNNGFLGTKCGGEHQAGQTNSRVGVAKATYKAMWIPKGLSVTYHVGEKVNGRITGMTEVATFPKKAGEAMGDAKKKPSDYGATKGWYSDEKCTTKKDVPEKMPTKSLNFYGYTEGSGTGDNPGGGTIDPPDLEEAEKGTARIYYLVDGDVAGDYTVQFSSKYGTGNGSNIGQVGVQQAPTSYSENSMRKYNRDGKWDVAKAKFSGTYQQATDVEPGCMHSYVCCHHYTTTCGSGKNTWTCTLGYDDTGWVHGSCSNQGKDTRYEYTSTKSVSSSCQSGSGVNDDLGHLADKGSDWRYASKSTKFKWFNEDGSAADTSVDLKSGDTKVFYAYTEHDVTYTVNDPKGYEKKSDTPSGKREWTHRELYTFMEDPTAIGPEEGSECASGTDTKFRESELPAPYAEFSGWYKDPSCSGTEVEDPEQVGTNALHYYGYTTHEVKWYGNPIITGDAPVKSEEIRYGFDTGKSSDEALEDVKSSISDDEDRYELVYWHKDTNGKPNDFDKNGVNSNGSEGAVPNLTFTCITFHDGHFIMDNGTDAERDWKITELGGQRVKAGTTQKCPTGSYVSGKVTLPNCEDWATRATEDGLVPNQWFMDDGYATKTDTVTIDGDDWGTRYSYNANYLTMDFTKYAKGLDKSLEGKYQLFKEKVERKTEHSAKQLGSLRDYLESTQYEACRNCSHTEHSKLYQGGSERISNHHFYKYGDDADVPQLPACYWLNDSKLNNTGYNKGDALLSRNARNPEGGAYTDEGAKGGMVGTSYTVRGNTVLYLDYVQGLYDGVITG